MDCHRLPSVKREYEPEIINLDDSDSDPIDDHSDCVVQVIKSPHFAVNHEKFNLGEDPIVTQTVKPLEDSDDDMLSSSIFKKSCKRIKRIIDSDDDDQPAVKEEPKSSTECIKTQDNSVDDQEVSPRKSIEAAREASFPEPEIPNGYEDDDNFFEASLEDFNLDDDIHGDENEEAFPGNNDNLNENVLADIGSSPVMTPEPEEVTPRPVRSPLVSIDVQSSPITSRKRSERTITLQRNRQQRIEDLVAARTTKQPVVFEEVIEDSVSPFDCDEVPDSPRRPESSQRDRVSSFDCDEVPDSPRRPASPRRGKVSSFDCDVVPDSPRRPALPRQDSSNYFSREEPRHESLPKKRGAPLASNRSDGVLPLTNLEEMIDYVASFDLKKRIRELNPGKANLDVESVIQKMQNPRQGITSEDNQSEQQRDNDFGVHDTPSFSLPFHYQEPTTASRTTTGPSNTFIPTAHHNPVPDNQMEFNLDDIDFDDEDFGNFDDDDDIQEMPASSKAKQPLCSTPSTSNYRSNVIATKEPFQITLGSTPGNMNQSFHEWDVNHGDDAKFKQYQYPFSAKLIDNFRNVFGMETFRTNQLEAITAALLGHDCFILMPTGGGKSLCYQLPAIIKKGVTVVISPLKSLIFDQVSKLKGMGVDVEYLSGDMLSRDVCNVYKRLKEYDPAVKLLYVTPERIGASPALNSVFDEMYESGTLARFVIDEAHCVSQWGHDFRPDYKKLSCLREKYKTVPIMAVTATANPRVRMDVCTHLKLENCKWFIQSFNRPNLKYEVRRKIGKSLDDIMSLILNQFSRDSGIIYCLSRKDCEKTAETLTAKGIGALAYHAGLPDKERNEVQTRWLHGRTKVICATIAFGMGIDKPDVRYVIHFCVPKSIEGYYQEAGRAGRDGKLAFCFLYYSSGDVGRLKKIMMAEKPKTSSEFESRKIDMENLNSMTFYAYNKAVCRRVQLTRYLGEGTKEKDLCRGKDPKAFCDNCESSDTFTQADVTAEAKLVVECVKELETQGNKKLWTMNHFLSIFSGSEVKAIMEAGHNKLKAYGKLAQHRIADREFLLRKLVIEGYLHEKVQMLPRSQIMNVYLTTGPQHHKLLKPFSEVKITMPLHNNPLVTDDAFQSTVDTPGTSYSSRRETTDTTSRFASKFSRGSRGRGSSRGGSRPRRGKNVDFFVNENQFDSAFNEYN